MENLAFALLEDCSRLTNLEFEFCFKNVAQDHGFLSFDVCIFRVFVEKETLYCTTLRLNSSLINEV